MTGCERAITALLVGKQNSCLPHLKECLDNLGIRTSCVERPSEVRSRLLHPEPPELIFTAAESPDCTWSEVLQEARRLGDQPVIVASRVVDVRLYLDTLDQGAFDFVAAPFQPRELRYIVDSAIARSRQAVEV